MKVLVSGASGGIGRYLVARLRSRGHRVRALQRQGHEHPYAYATDEIEWADALVNLAGAPLNKLPWTPKYKRTLLTSRVSTTDDLAVLIARAKNPPKVWVNASAVGFYGSRPGERISESTPAGDGFLADVCTQWEAATDPAQGATRIVYLRTGLVLSTKGVLSKLAGPTKFGLGTTFGDGSQYWPWVALEDEVGAIIHALSTSSISGPLNAVAPAENTCEEIVDAVAQKLGRKRILSAPKWALRLGIQQAADELLLADQLVVPHALHQSGYRFALPMLGGALSAYL